MFALVAFVIGLIFVFVMFSKFSKTFSATITNVALSAEDSSNALHKLTSNLKDSATQSSVESRLELKRWIRDHQQEIQDLQDIDPEEVFNKLANK